MKDYMTILGCKVKDRVTGFEGTASSVSFDLYGCVQVVVAPEMRLHEGEQKLSDSRYFDFKRLVKVSADPVMEVPAFEGPHVDSSQYTTPGRERGGDNYKPIPR